MVTQKCGWHPMVGVPHRICTLEEFMTTGTNSKDEIVIASLTYSNVGNIINHKVFTLEFQNWLKAHADYVLCRKDLFESVAKQNDRPWQLTIDTQTVVKDFRGLYKVVQG
jgi:hypothetical protein